MRGRDRRAVADDQREARGGEGREVGGGGGGAGTGGGWGVCCCAVRDNEFKHKPKVKQETWTCAEAVLITFTNTAQPVCTSGEITSSVNSGQ